MRESLHDCSTLNIEQMADEIVAQRKTRRRQKYPGLSSAANRGRLRYANAEWVTVSCKLRIRKLSAWEITELRTCVRDLMDGKVQVPVRLDE